MDFFNFDETQHMDCFFALFQDALFEHDDKVNYVFDSSGNFKRRSLSECVQSIAHMVDSLYKVFTMENSFFDMYNPIIDYPALGSALSRYSRDIYGFRRIKAKLLDLGDKMSPCQKEMLEQIVLSSADFGFKIPSDNPYIDRHVAVLLYWFSVLKPFHLTINKEKYDKNRKPIESYKRAYFNEYTSYFLMCIGVRPLSISINIHKEEALFENMLNQLHFRNLSRSSLEFFMASYKTIVT